MSSHARSAALLGIDVSAVDVEADVGQGLPNIIIVGLPDAAVQESKERVRTAFRASGLPFPRTRLTVNLAPADIKKEGPAYDLPIAVAILRSLGLVPPDTDAAHVFLGELTLDGCLRPVSGSLPVAAWAAKEGHGALYLPVGNAPEAAMIDGVRAYPVRTLVELIAHLRGESTIEAATPPAGAERPTAALDFRDIRGHAKAKRALEIAAAGGHNLLLSGPPGSGKSMLAKALPSILPSMRREEMIEVTTIASVAGSPEDRRGLVSTRPFRAPHHTASGVAVIGGGAWPRPGEVSLAHRGVLFLDEFPEFPRSVLENLRQPLEDGIVAISRASCTVRFPSKFILVAAMNPCPCGFSTDEKQICTCTPSSVSRYRKKLSGPLMDRIDLHVEVPKIPFSDFLGEPSAEPSEEIRERVEAARMRQNARFGGAGPKTNSEMTSRDLRGHCILDPAGEALFRAAGERLALSGRGATRVLKVARTIADIDGSDRIDQSHIAEAIMFRERQHA